MREIKFRGKRVDNGEWVYGHYYKDILNPCILAEGQKIEDFERHFILKQGFADWNMESPINKHHVIPETVGQFTGLTDKNGKDIYEGDMVYSKNWNPEKQEVTFDRGGFCLKYDDSEYYPDIKYAEKMEIIGNIHEK